MTRIRRAALGGILGGTLLIGGAYAQALPGGPAARWAAPAFVVGMASIIVGLMVLGAASARGIGRLVIPFAFVWLLLVGGFGLVFMVPATESPGLWLGLPPATAIVLYGIGLVPALVLPLAYALTFDSATLRPEDLERVRAAREERVAAERAFARGAE